MSQVSIDNGQLKALTDRLDAIVRFLAYMLPKDMTQRDKIMVLSEIGIQPKVIASMLGTTPNTVSVALSILKKSKSKEIPDNANPDRQATVEGAVAITDKSDSNDVSK